MKFEKWRPHMRISCVRPPDPLAGLTMNWNGMTRIAGVRELRVAILD
jgi:hypothetical protein